MDIELNDEQLRAYAEMDYYEILEVERNATSSEIKKAYYKKARVYHPDKNQGDHHAEEMFKLVLEAYTILMDEEKRAFYDQYGKEMLENQSQGIIDFQQLVSLLFGGNLFVDIVGEMKLYMLDGLMTPQETPEDELVAQEVIREHKAQRVIELAAILTTILEPHLQGDTELFREGLDEGLEAKLEHPFGRDIIRRVAYVYSEIGKRHMGRFLGVESFVTGVKQTVHTVSNGISLISSGMTLMKMQQEMQINEEQGLNMDETSQKRFFDAAMYTIWKIGKLEIEEILREVCETVINQDRPSKKKTAKALYAAGEYYKTRLKGLDKGVFSEKILQFQSDISPRGFENDEE